MRFLWVLAACSSAPTLSATVTMVSGSPQWTLELPAGADVPQGVVQPTVGRDWIAMTSEGSEGQRVLGTYRREGDALIFRPVAPPAPGKTLSVTVTGATHSYSVPSATSITRLIVIEPLSTQLPANQLKFYLRFSASMRHDMALWDRVDLIDNTVNDRVDGFWHKVPLWSNDGRTATLVVADMGPGLIEGHRYTLRVDPELTDRLGEVVGGSLVRSFNAGPMDHDTLDLEDWIVHPVAVGTSEPLRVVFDEPVDRDMARAGLAVRRSGEAVPGVVKVNALGEAMSFVPESPWQDGRHSLVLVDRVEDLAGNTATTLLDARADRMRLTAPRPMQAKAREFRPKR